MPVALIRTEPSRAHAPLASLDVRLGSDPTCDVVDAAPGVAPLHARLRYVKGEWLLAPEDDQRVLVNDAEVPILALHDGDVVRLSERGRPWRFRDRLADTFIAPGMDAAATWIAHPRFREPGHGPESVPANADWVVKRGLLLKRAEDAGRHLRLLARLGGSPHRALARLVDGGLHPHEGGVARWMATRFVAGTVAAEAIRPMGLPTEDVLPALRRLAAGLAHLHARGVIHRDVAPGNVVLTADGAVLIDFDRAVLAGEPLGASAGVTGTAGYVAPEEVLEGAAAVTPAVDVYGLCAVAYALLVGHPPAGGADVLDALSRATRRAVPPRELGVELPAAFEQALLAGLDPDPAARPDAAALRASWDEVGRPLHEGERT